MSSMLGPSYDYWKSIKQPDEMGMSPGFSLGALATNVDGLLSYVEVLISGTGNASVTGKPLGNKFFLKTTGQCSETTAEKWKKEQDEDAAWEKAYQEVDNKLGAKEITEDQATKLKNALNEDKAKRDEERSKEKKRVERWIYVNNIPDGSIPFISSGADGRGFQSLRGLIPGALGNLGALNPVQLFNGFTAGTYPDCAKITLETVDNNNAKSSETRHIAMIDMAQLNPCSFPGRYNPASGKSCQNRSEGFDEMKKEKTRDIYNTGVNEIGNLAGSSGIAYQQTHRSPLSYNISPMTDLKFDTFERHAASFSSSSSINAREVIEQHNRNVSSFYNSLMERIGGGGGSEQEIENEDLSTIRGDTMSQIYYYGVTAILLYVFYRMLYKRRK